MKKKLKSIMLVDDDFATNYIHKRVINEAGVCEEVIDFQNAFDALDFLKEMKQGSYPSPDIIFLDINMPGMDGWEFLEEYDNLLNAQKATMVVVMLTTSFNPDDESFAKKIPHLNGFEHKPLTNEKLNEILNQNFPQLFE